MTAAQQTTQVPGQVALPGMADELGYEAIKLKTTDERFCWEYVLNGGNATRAYLKASPGVTLESARRRGSKLLTSDDINARVEQVRVELRRKYAVTAEDVILYHSKVLKIDRQEFLDDVTGKPRKLEDIDSEAASILEFDCERDAKSTVVHVMLKVPTRHSSAVELAKIMGMNKENLALSGGMKMEPATTTVDDMERFEAFRAKLRKDRGESE